MSRPRRFLFVAVGLAALAFGVREAWWWHRYLGLACGYAAKVTASCLSISGRDLDSVRAEELAPFGALDVVVDRRRREVVASAFGVWQRVARWRDGAGSTLVMDTEVEVVDVERGTTSVLRSVDAPWPIGERVGAGVVDRRLRAAVDVAFDEPDPELPRRTRAVVVVHRGRIVAERYAPGFGPDTPQHGWSMTKSVMNALIGVLVLGGRLRLEDAAPIPELAGVADARAAITVDQLLRMESGLGFVEAYDDPSSDALQMLFGSDDMAAFVASRPLRAAPGTVWSYSSGTSVLVARVVRTVVGEGRAREFARDELFARTGMTTALIEMDAAGTMVGSSMGWASARDWARFGLLYLRDGEWLGDRVLPEGWVAYSTTPTPNAPGGRFGAHWWLNAGDATGRREWPSLPADVFWAAGYQGQFVVVVPGADMVVVRLGQTTDGAHFPMEGLVRRLLEVVR